jgi:hypothetical protein
MGCLRLVEERVFTLAEWPVWRINRWNRSRLKQAKQKLTLNYGKIQAVLGSIVS